MRISYQRAPQQWSLNLPPHCLGQLMGMRYLCGWTWSTLSKVKMCEWNLYDRGRTYHFRSAFSQWAFHPCVHIYTFIKSKIMKVIQITSQVASNFCQILFLKAAWENLDCAIHELLELWVVMWHWEVKWMLRILSRSSGYWALHLYCRSEEIISSNIWWGSDSKSWSHRCVAQKAGLRHFHRSLAVFVLVCWNGATAFWENCLHTVTCKNDGAQQWQDPQYTSTTHCKASRCLPWLGFSPLYTMFFLPPLLGHHRAFVTVVVVVYNQLLIVCKDLKSGGKHWFTH